MGTCARSGCSNEATKLRCPACMNLKLEDAFFCSQKCFTAAWPTHKLLHALCSGTNTVSQVSKLNIWPNYSYTGTLQKAEVTPRRDVPEHIPRPDYAIHPHGVSLEEKNSKTSGQIVVLNEEEKEGLRLACKLGREVLDEAARAIAPGVTTDEIDRVVHEACIERDCYPSPLGYYKFPKSCCTSVNEVICHGIPDLRPLVDGDLCNVDVTVYHRGFHGDLNETFFVGDNVDDMSKKLVKTTYECLNEAIKIVAPGVKYRAIGDVISKVAHANGFSVVRSYCGHGIHRLFHTAPNVPHYAMSWLELGAWHALSWLGIENKALGVMKAGNSFTIEPMINMGTHHDDHWPDEWTAVTRDGKRSAQFEQTLLVTETGCEILTQRGTGQPWFMDKL
uniref:Methionine aminopeptidase n=1 Tax=Steinernema glaseri TaxID=37863 RepID=A0A1I7ZC14_9BILA